MILDLIDLFEKAPARRNGLSLGSALVSHREVIWSLFHINVYFHINIHYCLNQRGDLITLLIFFTFFIFMYIFTFIYTCLLQTNSLKNLFQISSMLDFSPLYIYIFTFTFTCLNRVFSHLYQHLVLAGYAFLYWRIFIFYPNFHIFSFFQLQMLHSPLKNFHIYIFPAWDASLAS